MAKFEAKLKAFELRRMGWSIGAIAIELQVAKSTVSLWCRDIKLTKSQKSKLEENAIRAGHKGRLLGAQANKQKRLDNITTQREFAKRIVGSLSERDKLMLGIALYWGGGNESYQH